jgi:hypothetical protein
MTGLCSSNCDTCICLSHFDITMFGRLQRYYDRQIVTYVFHIVESQCNICQHEDMFIAL